MVILLGTPIVLMLVLSLWSLTFTIFYSIKKPSNQLDSGILFPHLLPRGKLSQLVTVIKKRKHLAALSGLLAVIVLMVLLFVFCELVRLIFNNNNVTGPISWSWYLFFSGGPLAMSLRVFEWAMWLMQDFKNRSFQCCANCFCLVVLKNKALTCLFLVIALGLLCRLHERILHITTANYFFGQKRDASLRKIIKLGDLLGMPFVLPPELTDKYLKHDLDDYDKYEPEYELGYINGGYVYNGKERRWLLDALNGKTFMCNGVECRMVGNKDFWLAQFNRFKLFDAKYYCHRPWKEDDLNRERACAISRGMVEEMKSMRLKEAGNYLEQCNPEIRQKIERHYMPRPHKK